MLTIQMPERPLAEVEIITPFAPRKIRAAFHDIDGTHSLIRKWVPVMTLVTGATARYGVFPGTPEELAEFLRSKEQEDFSEAHRFAVESAGLSALTQMEWAIRMSRRVTNSSSPGNEAAIRAIWQGNERFEVPGETPEERDRIEAEDGLLFRAYEILLRSMCRDRNLELARQDPAAWRVSGSMEFLKMLRDNGVRNYFVTGAVVDYDDAGNPLGTMAEEIRTLGYEVGKGKLIEAFRGSTWDKKLPKNELMRALCDEYGFAPDELLVVGDGRSEIAAAAELGAIALSRLDADAARAREIHRALHTNLIVADYAPDAMKELFIPSPVIIREIRREDAAAASAVHFLAFKSYLKDLMTRKEPEDAESFFQNCNTPERDSQEAKTFVAEEDGVILGSLKADADLIRKLGTLCDIGVQPGLGKRGVGHKLFLAAEAWWKSRGIERVWTCVSSINPGALQFYLKQGFKIDCVKKDVFFKGVDETYLIKNIKNEEP